MDRFDYVIVGAGSAGCVLAAKLTENPDISVLVLEAGERPGGRAVVDSSLGPAVDLGAAWIHCGDENPLTELAHRLGLTLVADPHDVRAYRDGVEETADFARSLQRIHFWIEPSSWSLTTRRSTTTDSNLWHTVAI